RPLEREGAFAGAEVGVAEELVGGDEPREPERGGREEPKRAPRADADVGARAQPPLGLEPRAARRVRVVARDPGAREPPEEGVLDAIGAPAEGREAAPAAGGAGVGGRMAACALPAGQGLVDPREREGDAALGAARHGAAVVARERRGEAGDEQARAA